MLSCFEVENYGNFIEKLSIEWNQGISCVFGKCGAGKTTLCMALKDIITEQDLKNQYIENNGKFKYIFLIEDIEIEIVYERKKNGRIYCGCIKIEKMLFEFILKNEVNVPIDMMKKSVKYAKVKNLKRETEILEKCMNMFQQKEYVVEVTENDKSVEWNKVRNDLKKEYLKRNSKRTKIKIIDDVDDSEIDRIKKEGIDSEVQIIVFARRSCWIDECIAPLDNYYYINGGKMIKMINGIEKEIKTVYQLKKLFLKGIYDI